MRTCVYIHVGAVACCVAFSRADLGRIGSIADSRLFIQFADVLLGFALAAWILCPLIVTVAVVRDPIRRNVLAFLAEVALTITQIYALLPMCQ